MSDFDPISHASLTVDSKTKPASWLSVLVALALSFLLPGFGYWFLGQKAKGYVVAAGVMGLFVAGLLIGGVTVVDQDAPNPPLVRVGQRFLAATWVTSSLRERYMPDVNRAEFIVSGQTPGLQVTPSYGRMEEQGVLYTSVAGFLSLLVMVDLVGKGLIASGEAQRLNESDREPKTLEKQANNTGSQDNPKGGEHD